jgi:4-amino-4-deoxy-L-arabinose transferase-like glycosyltransferase
MFCQSVKHAQIDDGGEYENPERQTSGRQELRRDLLLILILILAVIPLRIWQICNTEVTARDSIGYIRIAWQLKEKPWSSVVKTADQHPGYPLVLLAVSIPIQHFLDAPECMVMQWSAQLSSAFFGLMLIVPMFYLGKELYSRSAGFWTAAFFQAVPAGSRVLPDGLSEATFLFLAALGMLLAVHALRKGSPLLFGLAGLFSGLAYLVRPEGALVAAAAGLVLFATQIIARQRKEWKRAVLGACCLALGWGLIAAPYILAIDGFTVKLSSKFIMNPALKQDQPLGKEISANSKPAPEFASAVSSSVSGVPTVLGVWLNDKNPSRATLGLKAVCFEIAKGFGFVAWIPALLGMWWYRGILKTRPGSWILLIVSLCLFLLLWRLASVVGYVSERHTVLMILCGSFPAVAATLLIGQKVSGWLMKFGPHFFRLANKSQLIPAFLVLALIGSVLPKSFEPLHSNRSGFRDAGLWLAAHALPSDEIVDPYCWAHYYAGRVFLEGSKHDDSQDNKPICYVVLEQSGNSHLRLTEIPAAKRMAAQGKLVFEWEGKRNKDHCIVRVYAFPKTEPVKAKGEIAGSLSSTSVAGASNAPRERPTP